ncbi:MAG TPA: hypothetical protein VNI79_03690 [Sphingomicrobium sp.]|nr:hypothetical protein [Sphingomicrobium sp.]
MNGVCNFLVWVAKRSRSADQLTLAVLLALAAWIVIGPIGMLLMAGAAALLIWGLKLHEVER